MKAPPTCCGAPMRPVRFPGWICNGGAHPLDGKGCERFESSDGVRTAGPWWAEPPGLAQRTRERIERAAARGGDAP